MSEAADARYRPRLASLRVLILLTAMVVMVDIGAAVLQIVGNERTSTARAEVTAGLNYQADMSSVMEYTLDAETSERGYLLTGDPSYLQPTEVAIQKTPAVLQTVQRASSADPVLRRDYPKLQALVEAQMQDLTTDVDLYRAGQSVKVIEIVKTNRGNQITEQIRTLVAAMSARSARRVARARAWASGTQTWESRANLAAYLSSALLLLAMVTLFRAYRLTERARRESRRAQLEAERLNLAKSGFLSRVSHELRTPLNAILGFGQLLERDLFEQGELETMGQILGAGRHLLAIVDDLVELSRIESGDLRLSIEPVQVADVLAEANALISPAATAAAVGVRQRPVNVELYVRADRQRLLQVLLNLVSNAVKYNRRGGTVMVSAVRSDGSRVRIEVSDTGSGISKEAIGRLFTPFERLDAATRGIEGTGLGLALARGLVESMDGTLTLSSEEGVGTTVAFELPLSSADELARTRPQLRAVDVAVNEFKASDQRLRAAISVLYVEDNPSNVRLVEKIFALSSDLGLTVARDGASGVKLASELRPDLILLDLHLPDMPGEQVLAAVRGDPQIAETPIVIVSADASPVQAKRLVSAGANGYLTKPFDIDELLAAVRTRGTLPPAADALDAVDSLLDPPMVGSLHVLSANTAVGPGQIGQMLETFREDALATLSGVHEAIAEANLAAAERQAHRLAGGAGAVGAGRFRVLCKQLEAQAGAHELEQCRTLDTELDPLFQQTWEALVAEFTRELDQQTVHIQPPPV